MSGCSPPTVVQLSGGSGQPQVVPAHTGARLYIPQPHDDLERHGSSQERTGNILGRSGDICDTQGLGRINKSPLDTAGVLLAFGINEFLH